MERVTRVKGLSGRKLTRNPILDPTEPDCRKFSRWKTRLLSSRPEREILDVLLPHAGKISRLQLEMTILRHSCENRISLRRLDEIRHVLDSRDFDNLGENASERPCRVDPHRAGSQLGCEAVRRTARAG